MAEIPYVPVPTVRNTDASGAMISVPNANAQAFGAGVGEAMQRLGASIGHASDVAAQKSIEFQNIQNETKANDVLLAGAKEFAEEELKLKSLDGQNAVDYLPTYNKNIDAIRQRIIGSADNSAVARLVDTALRRRATDAIISGAGYGAGAARSARDASRTGVISMAQTQAASASDMEFEQSIQQIEKTAREQADEKFGPGPAADSFVQTQVNEAFVKRVEMKSLTDPFGAKEFVDKNRSRFTADGYQRAIQVVNQTAVQVGSRNIANKTAPESQQMGAFAGAIRSIESGSVKGNYEIVGPVTKKGDRAYGAYQVMGANIPSWTKEVLGVAMTPDQFLKDRSAQDKVFAVKFKQFIDKYGSAAEAASVWFTGRPVAQGGDSADVTGTTGYEYVRRFRSALATTGIGSDVAAPTVTSAEETAAWVKRARDEATRQFPDNPAVADQAEARVLQQVGRQERVAKDYQQQSFNAVQSATLGMGRDKPPTNLDELFGNDTNMRKAYFGLAPSLQAEVLKVLRDNAAGKVKVWTPEAIAEESRLRGLAETNPEEFKRTFLPGANIPKEGIDKLMKLQQELTQGKSSDGSLTQALNVIKGTGFLDQIGLDPVQEPERYQKFVGVLEKAMDTWRLQNPRHQGPVPSDAIVKMLPAFAKDEVITKRPFYAPDQTGKAFEANPNKAVDDAVERTKTPNQILMDSGIPGSIIEPLRQQYFQKYNRAPSIEDLRTMYFSSPQIMKKFPPTKAIPWLTPRRDSMLQGGEGQIQLTGGSSDDRVGPPVGAARLGVTRREAILPKEDQNLREYQGIMRKFESFGEDNPTDSNLEALAAFRRIYKNYRTAPTADRQQQLEEAVARAKVRLQGYEDNL